MKWWITRCAAFILAVAASCRTGEDNTLGTSKTRWEYLTDTNFDPAHMAELGAANWELVAVEPFTIQQGVRTAWYRRKVTGK